MTVYGSQIVTFCHNSHVTRFSTIALLERVCDKCRNPMKKCLSCLVEKDVEEFYRSPRAWLSPGTCRLVVLCVEAQR